MDIKDFFLKIYDLVEAFYPHLRCEFNASVRRLFISRIKTEPMEPWSTLLISIVEVNTKTNVIHCSNTTVMRWRNFKQVYDDFITDFDGLEAWILNKLREE
jgi:hypothetical protein